MSNPTETATFYAAIARGEQRRFGPHATGAHYEAVRDRIVVELSTGVEISFSPKRAQGLESARSEELAEIEITPSGLGLHFPKIDADIYIPALLEGMLGSANGWQGRWDESEGPRAQRPRRRRLGRTASRAVARARVPHDVGVQNRRLHQTRAARGGRLCGGDDEQERLWRPRSRNCGYSSHPRQAGVAGSGVWANDSQNSGVRTAKFGAAWRSISATAGRPSPSASPNHQSATESWIFRASKIRWVSLHP